MSQAGRHKPKIDPALVTAQFVGGLLLYDAETGLFTWRVNRGGTALAGTQAGSPDAGGYILIRIGNRNFKAHRLAILCMTGEWPVADVDHVNGVTSDNRRANLRDVTHSQNLSNCGLHGHNTSGSCGVSWREDKKKWRAFIQQNAHHRHLGYFATKSEAEAARARAAVEYVGGPVRSINIGEQQS